MWTEQIRNGIQAFILPIAGTVFMLIAKILLEKIVAERKILAFLANFVPTVAFLAASTSTEMCHVVGTLFGETETIGFSILVMFGFMFLINTILFLYEHFSDKPLKANGKVSKDKGAKRQ